MCVERLGVEAHVCLVFVKKWDVCEGEMLIDRGLDVGRGSATISMELCRSKEVTTVACETS